MNSGGHTALKYDRPFFNIFLIRHKVTYDRILQSIHILINLTIYRLAIGTIKQITIIVLCLKFINHKID